MTKVIIDPGVCGLPTRVSAVTDEDQQEVTLEMVSGCEAVRRMFDALGNTFDAFELCLGKPGTGELYQYAAEHFPGHCSCPVIAGIIKCAEAECGLALKKDTSIHFVEE